MTPTIRPTNSQATRTFNGSALTKQSGNNLKELAIPTPYGDLMCLSPSQLSIGQVCHVIRSNGDVTPASVTGIKYDGDNMYTTLKVTDGIKKLTTKIDQKDQPHPQIGLIPTLSQLSPDEAVNMRLIDLKPGKTYYVKRSNGFLSEATFESKKVVPERIKLTFKLSDGGKKIYTCDLNQQHQEHGSIYYQSPYHKHKQLFNPEFSV